MLEPMVERASATRLYSLPCHVLIIDSRAHFAGEDDELSPPYLSKETVHAHWDEFRSDSDQSCRSLGILSEAGLVGVRRGEDGHNADAGRD